MNYIAELNTIKSNIEKQIKDDRFYLEYTEDMSIIDIKSLKRISSPCFTVIHQESGLGRTFFCSAKDGIMSQFIRKSKTDTGISSCEKAVPFMGNGTNVLNELIRLG